MLHTSKFVSEQRMSSILSSHMSHPTLFDHLLTYLLLVMSHFRAV